MSKDGSCRSSRAATTCCSTTCPGATACRNSPGWKGRCMSNGVDDSPAASVNRSTRVDAATLERELAWFEAVLKARIHRHFQQPGPPASIEEVPPPELAGDS